MSPNPTLTFPRTRNAIFAIFFLLLLMAQTTNGIRLVESSFLKKPKMELKEFLAGECTDAECSQTKQTGSGSTKKGHDARKAKELRNMLAGGIHEDYYSPKDNHSKHHRFSP